MKKNDDYIKRAAAVVPSERQLKWHELEFYAFIHFGMNTFTNSEWGNGNDDPVLFNPEKLNANQWAAAVRAAGMKAIILTCKHHDGFCLWPSEYTDYSVKKSKWKDGQGDVVRECAEACKKFGLKFGVYLSPWDRHDPRYGEGEAYNKYFKNQLRELLTNYGDIFCVWFDGACGEGKNGRATMTLSASVSPRRLFPSRVRMSAGAETRRESAARASGMSCRIITAIRS